MTTDQRIIVRDNYNAVAQRVAAEWAALDAGHGCDPTRLAQDTAALIDALKQQRDEAQRNPQFLDMRKALSAAGVEHIGLPVAEAITALAKQRDEELAEMYAQFKNYRECVDAAYRIAKTGKLDDCTPNCNEGSIVDLLRMANKEYARGIWEIAERNGLEPDDAALRTIGRIAAANGEEGQG